MFKHWSLSNTTTTQESAFYGIKGLQFVKLFFQVFLDIFAALLLQILLTQKQRDVPSHHFQSNKEAKLCWNGKYGF